MTIPTQYKEMWQLADELAEKESLEFMQSPYASKAMQVRGVEKGLPITSLTHSEYKDEARQRHINRMLSIYEILNGGGE